MKRRKTPSVALDVTWRPLGAWCVFCIFVCVFECVLVCMCSFAWVSQNLALWRGQSLVSFCNLLTGMSASRHKYKCFSSLDNILSKRDNLTGVNVKKLSL